MADPADQVSTQLAGLDAARARVNTGRSEARTGCPSLARPYSTAVDNAAASVVIVVDDAYTKGTRVAATARCLRT